jgi:tetratricopeptide (TPR) repeat protein
MNGLALLRGRWCGVLAGWVMVCCGSLRLLGAEAAAKEWRHDMSAGQKAWEHHQVFDAAKYFESAVREAEQLEPTDSGLADSLSSLAKVRCELGALNEAEALLRRCLALDEQRRGSNDLRTLQDVLDLAGVSGQLDHFAEADALYLRAQAGMAARFGRYDRTVGICLLDRGNLLEKQGRLQEAEPLCEEALRLLDSTRFKPDFRINRRLTSIVEAPNPAEVTGALVDLGLLYRREKKFDKAEPSLKRALEMEEQWYGRKSVRLVAALNDLALVYADQRRYSEAEPLLLRSLKIMKTSDPNHPLLVQTGEILAQVRRAEVKLPDGAPSTIR